MRGRVAILPPGPAACRSAIREDCRVSTPQAALLFAASLALSVASSLILARALDRIGTSLGITDALLGILTALGADAPEISTAATALVTHHAGVGVGVVLGSNVFNLAGLLGLSALLAGRVVIGRRAALLEGGAALLVAGLAVLLVVGALPAAVAAALVVVVLIPYVWLASQRPAELGGARRWLAGAAVEAQQAARPDHHARPATRRDVAAVLPALLCVILASVGMVHAAVATGDRLSISQAVMGTLVLAVLTSIPNALAAIRLALHGRGAAVISEAFNSNSANVLAGLCIPAAVLGLGGRAGVGELTAWWAFGLTALAVWLLAAGRGIGRGAGAAIVLVYGAFVAAVLIR